ncbi:pectin lyase fold/virulence factor [Powellomyces hirtus]|nr:pectin lyase fold/virulence factor [Powellomyces hirtus]
MLLANILGFPLIGSAAAQRKLTGIARGYGAQTTGGGELAPIIPTSPQNLAELLKDSQPRQELGCRPSSNKCPDNGGQDAIGNGIGWCRSVPRSPWTHDVAATKGMEVNSHKSIRGIGAGAVIRGKGLWITGSNVIVQNVHITKLNLQYIWGGDAIYINGPNDLIWLDHLKFSKIGRELVVTDKAATRGMTISYNDCNNQPYWTIIFGGTDDWIFSMAIICITSADAGPRLKVHAVNNYWQSVHGHAFNLMPSSTVVVEGSYFGDVTTPLLGKEGNLYIPDATLSLACRKSSLNRACVLNNNVQSGFGNAGSKTRILALNAGVGKI